MFALSLSRLAALKQDGPSIIKVASGEVVQGDIVDELIDKVERDKVDLIVISSRRLGLNGRMLGSVTESLLSRCLCSLLIVHAEEHGGNAIDDYTDEELSRMFRAGLLTQDVRGRPSRQLQRGPRAAAQVGRPDLQFSDRHGRKELPELVQSTIELAPACK